MLERYIASAKQEAVDKHAMVAPRAKSFFAAKGWMLISIIVIISIAAHVPRNGGTPRSELLALV